MSEAADPLDPFAVDVALWATRGAPVARLGKLFANDHLTGDVRLMSMIFLRAAERVLVTQPVDTPEVTECLRKLWEAKNLAVLTVARP